MSQESLPDHKFVLESDVLVVCCPLDADLDATSIASMVSCGELIAVEDDLLPTIKGRRKEALELLVELGM